MDLRIEGTEKLHTVYRDLKRVGDVDLKKALTKAIRESTKPLKGAVKQSFATGLPKRNGLAKLIADSRLTNVVKTGSQSAGVTIKATSLHHIASINKGKLRHRVFGKGPWVSQAVRPNLFTAPIEQHKADIQKAVVKACEDIARELSDNGSRGRTLQV